MYFWDKRKCCDRNESSFHCSSTDGHWSHRSVESFQDNPSSNRFMKFELYLRNESQAHDSSSCGTYRDIDVTLVCSVESVKNWTFLLKSLSYVLLVLAEVLQEHLVLIDLKLITSVTVRHSKLLNMPQRRKTLRARNNRCTRGIQRAFVSLVK